jgi:hypothetical protein
MLMYSLGIDRYEVDRSASVVRASGLMRSITRVAGHTQEDVLHDFVAIAVDRGHPGPDRFDVHFVTPFWTPSNAMATKSTEHSGWVRFGGDLVMGEVRVRP